MDQTPLDRDPPHFESERKSASLSSLLASKFLPRRPSVSSTPPTSNDKEWVSLIENLPLEPFPTSRSEGHSQTHSSPDSSESGLDDSQARKIPGKQREKIETIFMKLLENKEIDEPQGVLTKQSTLRPPPKRTLGSFVGKFRGRSNSHLKEDLSRVSDDEESEKGVLIEAELDEEQQERLLERKIKVANILERISPAEIEQEIAKAKKLEKGEKVTAKKKEKKSSKPKRQSHSVGSAQELLTPHHLPTSSQQIVLNFDREEEFDFSSSESEAGDAAHSRLPQGLETPLRASAAAAAAQHFPEADIMSSSSAMPIAPPRTLRVPEPIEEHLPQAPANLGSADLDLMKFSPAASPTAMSQFELEALKAFTSAEGDYVLGENSAEVLRQMAASHKQETQKDSEILLALMQYAEEEEKLKASSDQSSRHPPAEATPVRAAPAPRPTSSIAKAALELLARKDEAPVEPSGKGPRNQTQQGPSTQQSSLPQSELQTVDLRGPSEGPSSHVNAAKAGGFRAEVPYSMLPLPPTKLTVSRVEKIQQSEEQDLNEDESENAPLNAAAKEKARPSWKDAVIAAAAMAASKAGEGLSKVKELASSTSKPAAGSPSEHAPLTGPGGASGSDSLQQGSSWKTRAKDALSGMAATVGSKFEDVKKWASESKFERVPTSDAKVAAMDGDGEDPKRRPRSRGAAAAECLCSWKYILIMGISSLFLVWLLAMLAVHLSRPSLQSPVESPPPFPSPSTGPPPTDANVPQCAGPCCSGSAAFIPNGVPTTLSMWWSSQLAHGSKVQLRCLSINRWLGPESSGANWRKIGAYQSSLGSADFFSVIRVNVSQIQLRSPEGFYVIARRDGSLAADQIVNGPETIFTVVQASNSSSRVMLQAWDEKYLVVLPDGSLGRSINSHLAETFEVREVMHLHAPRGVNLGGWLLAEEWIDPSLFITVPIFVDGLSIQIESLHYGTWLTITASNQIKAAVKDPGEWETFRVRASGNDTFQFLSAEYLLFSALGGGQAGIYASAELAGPEGYESFKLIFNPNTPTEFMMVAANGNFVAVGPDGTLAASVTPDSVDLRAGSAAWGGPTAFGYNETGALRGEWQLSHFIDTNAVHMVDLHRQTWVTEEDFAWLSEQNINAVRIPLGFWIAEGNSSGYPFASEAVPYLDSAFEWASKYGMQVYLSMNGAAGSQNGLEHSGSRDGVPRWSTNATNVQRTLDAIEWLVSRYASMASFFGIGLLNQPSSEVHLNVLRQYYLDAYERVRQYSACAFVGIQPRMGADPYELDDLMTTDHYTNVMVERQMFNLFNPRFSEMSFQSNIDFVMVNRTEEIADIEDAGKPVTIGGWSLGLPALLDPSTDDLHLFADAQLDAFGKASAGWYFFNYKNYQYNWSTWDFRDGVMNGWLRQKDGGGW